MLCSLFLGSASAEDYQAYFKSHCIKCHGPKKQEEDLRLDTITQVTANPASIETWSSIVESIEAGDMPPEKEPRPDPVETRRLVTWISGELSKNFKPVPALRRLNRTEYEHTVHDLLGVDALLADVLPEDASVQGFDNVVGGLGISPILLERYLEAADIAFDDVIRRIEPLPPATRRSVLIEDKNNIGSIKKKSGGVIQKDGAYIDFTPGWPPARIDEAHPHEPGRYRCRIAVWPHNPNKHRTLSVGVYVGPLFGQGKRQFMGMYDVTGTSKNPRIIEFTATMQEGHSIHILPWIFPEHVTWRDKEEPRPGVAIAWAETHGPLDQSFPSEAQVHLFGKTDTVSLVPAESIYMRHRKGVKRHVVESSTPREDAARIVREFVPRAFRRPVADDLVDQFVRLTLARMEAGNSFEDSVRAGVSAVLCSPHFLLVNQEPKVDEYTIASRLSYFLWSSMPDEELLELAAAGKLSDPQVRHTQVERMLKDPKIERFVKNFTGQWLNLRDIEFTTPDKILYPEYDKILRHSMIAETTEFFRHILKNDLSVLNFIDSDFTFLNQRLANHYGIPGIRGHEKFRLVSLPEESIRGGLLTHASVLKVTANGTTTSPVLRGIWVLDKMLGQPPPPPPPGVPAIEPDIRGASTIREQLMMHRENEACNRCHVRLDAPGFALEEFNVIGGQREWYRTIGGTGDKIDKVRYRKGPVVEQGAELVGGRKFANFVEFRQQLLEDPDLIARAVAKQLLIYGSGRPVEAADRRSVRSVVEAAKKQKHGLRSMIHAVVESEIFLRP